MRKYSDAPKRIYLQHDPENTGEPFSQAFDVTWCQDRINRNDITYVRADTVKARVLAERNAKRKGKS